jgi:hypothetical protein
MTLLKKENWFVWVILSIITQGASTFALAAIMEVFDKDAWYAKWQYWVIGVLMLFAPALIMILIFSTEILCKTAEKLEVSGKEIYASPYIWILLFVIPVFGWILLLVMYFYLEIMILINLKRGYGEKFLKN